jgi:hypothetical protein
LLAFYVLCIVVATYPQVWYVGSALPGSLVDPLQHLWIMRWYKACLVQGRLPFFNTEVMYPIGVPMGNFSPLHLQSALYCVISLAVRQDVLCFNIIWIFGLLFTGVGTFFLIHQLLRNRAAAAFGGMLTMLSGPTLAHSQTHSELIYLGCFPIFLAAWIRFVDRPSRTRCFGAIALYLCVATCAAYYAAMAVVPAGLYVLWRISGAVSRRHWRWPLHRVPWLVIFAVATVVPLAFLFSNQLWSRSHGYSLDRSMYEFRKYGTSLWTYVIPTTSHALGRLLPCDVYDAVGFRLTHEERTSYLGITTLALILYLAVRHVRLPRASYYFGTLVILVILSCGAEWTYENVRVILPATWLKTHVFAFRQIRVPARFNLLAVVYTSILAAAGLRALLQRIHTPWRHVTYCALTALALADLAMFPYPRATIPPLPQCYTRALHRKPGATFLELPQYDSGGSYLYALSMYWQSLHGGRTNAGYSGHANMRYENLITHSSPFLAKYIEDPGYLRDQSGLIPGTDVVTQPSFCKIVTDVAFLDYVWLFTTVHGYDYLVLHQWRDPYFGAFDFVHLKKELSVAKVDEDRTHVVYDRVLLPHPTHPVVLLTNGWRPSWDGRPSRVAARVSRVAGYNPNPDQSLTLTVEAKALQRPRLIRVLTDSREIARWRIEPDRFQTYTSPQFRLPAGLQELILAADGEDAPIHRRDAAWETDVAPYSYRIARLTLSPVVEDVTKQP